MGDALVCKSPSQFMLYGLLGKCYHGPPLIWECNVAIEEVVTNLFAQQDRGNQLTSQAQFDILHNHPELTRESQNEW